MTVVTVLKTLQVNEPRARNLMEFAKKDLATSRATGIERE